MPDEFIIPEEGNQKEDNMENDFEELLSPTKSLMAKDLKPNEETNSFSRKSEELADEHALNEEKEQFSSDNTENEPLPSETEQDNPESNESNLNYITEEKNDLQVRIAVHSDYSEEQLNTFFQDLNINGINTEMKWNYNMSKDRLKKLVLEMCDAEGYVQKVVATDFDTIEIFWSIDDNGFPYDVFIVFDGNNEQSYPIDLKDKMLPVHRYKG